MKLLLAPDFKPSFFGETFPKDLLDIFIQARDDVGIKNISFWSSFEGSAQTKNSATSIAANTYNLGWLQKYITQGYSSADPVLLESLYSNAVQFTDYRINEDEKHKKFFDAVIKAGIGTYSITVPIHISSEIRSVTTFTFSAAMNPKCIQGPENIKKYRHYANSIVNILLRPQLGENSKNKLTDKELNILRGLSQGLKYDEIAKRSGVSRWTIVAHAKSIKAKLNAKTISEAVTTAISKNLI